MVRPPGGDVHRLHRDRPGRAGPDAGRFQPLLEAGEAHVALGHDPAVGLEDRHGVRAVPGAVLAADALVGLMGDDTVGELDVGLGGAADQAGRLEAVVARHRQVEAARVGEFPTFDLAHPPPGRPGRQAVLLRAGGLAGMAADAGLHREGEAVLLTGFERKKCRPGGSEPRPGVEDADGHAESLSKRDCPVVAAP